MTRHAAAARLMGATLGIEVPSPVMPEDKDTTVKATGTGRTLAIGDIHGCRASLENLAEFVGISDSDTVVTLGDYVDRGPDSKGVIELLIALGSTGTLITLRGNHEVMMLEAREDQMRCPRWLEFGGDTTLDSYGACPLAEIPVSHWEFLEATRNFHETDQFFFVHANANPDLPLEEQDASTFFGSALRTLRSTGPERRWSVATRHKNPARSRISGTRFVSTPLFTAGDG